MGNNNNSGNGNGGGDGNNNNSTNNFSNLLQSMQGSLNNLANNNSGNNSGANLQNAQSAIQLSNLLRQQNQNDSSTGLTALRMQEGLNQRNSSVEDFLSLVAAGDIPHQDPSLLDIPLMQPQGTDSQAAAAFLAQRQLLAQAASSRSLENLAGGSSSSNLHRTSSAAAL